MRSQSKLEIPKEKTIVSQNDQKRQKTSNLYHETQKTGEKDYLQGTWNQPMTEGINFSFTTHFQPTIDRSKETNNKLSLSSCPDSQQPSRS